MKSFSVLIAALLFSIFAFAQNSDDQVLATVGSKKITVGEFNKKFADVKNQALNPPTKNQFLEDLVRYEVGLLEATKRGLENDPVYKDRARQELYKALLEKDLGDKVQKITVSDKEMEEFYKKNPEIRSSHILIELKAGSTAEQKAEAKKRATEIYAEVQKSKRPFEELVKLYSDDQLSKQAGGDIGWQSGVTLLPNYYNTLMSMKIGEIRGLIETPYGFHVVKVTGRRAFENANKRALRAAVFDEKRKSIFNSYFDGLKKNYKPQINSKALE